jgi:hypothetical protein
MHSWASWTAKTVLVTTGFAVAGGGFAGAAFAGTGTGITNAGNISVLGGNQVNVPVSIPADICGNAVALLGGSTAGCQGGAQVTGAGALLGSIIPGGLVPGGSSDGGLTAGNVSAVSGSVVKVPVDIAANACGNAIGNSTAQCQGGVTVPAGSGLLPGGLGGDTSPHGGLDAGNVSVGSGNQVQIPVTVPANVCGNAAAILGDSSAGCEGGATVDGGHQGRVGHASLSDQLAGLGALPGVADLPSLAGLSSLPLLQGVSSGGALLPVSSLSAMQSNVDGGGMSGDSFVTLAVGALLAGAAALKLAGRRPGRRNGNAASKEVSA